MNSNYIKKIFLLLCFFLIAFACAEKITAAAENKSFPCGEDAANMIKPRVSNCSDRIYRKDFENGGPSLLCLSSNEEESGILTIAEYIQMALDYDPDVRIAGLKLEQQYAALKKTKAAFLPKVGLNSGINYSYDAKSPTKDAYNTTLNVSGKYNITSAGENPKNYEKSLVELEKAQAALTVAQEQVIFNSIQTFNNLLNLQMSVSIRRNEVMYFQNLAILSRKKDLTGIEYSRASVLLTQSEQRLLESIQKLDASKEDFMFLIGKEPSPELTVDTTLSFVELELNMGDCLKLAFANRKDFLQIEYAIEKQGKIINYAKRKGSPSVDIAAGYGWTPAAMDMSDALRQIFDLDRPKISTGILMTVPLYDGGERASDLKIEETHLTILENQRENMRRSITREVRQALNSFESAKSRYLLSGNTVTQTTKNLSSIFDKYSEGQANLEQVELVIGTFSNASISKTQALIDYYNSLALLNKATGSMEAYYRKRIVKEQ